MNIKGIVTIKFIDRKTNKIVKKITSNNVMLKNGAYCCLYGLTGLQSPNPIKKMVIFDTISKQIICLDVTVTSYETPGCLFTASDHSNAIYNIFYLTLFPENADYTSPENAYFACRLSSSYLKDDLVNAKIDWEIQISYNEPP